MCKKCLVVPLAGKGGKECVKCRYGKDFARCRVGADAHVPTCLLCHSSFSLLRRRHWCRRCGRTICTDCSATKIDLISRRHPRSIPQCVSGEGRGDAIRPLLSGWLILYWGDGGGQRRVDSKNSQTTPATTHGPSCSPMGLDVHLHHSHGCQLPNHNVKTFKRAMATGLRIWVAALTVTMMVQRGGRVSWREPSFLWVDDVFP